MLGRNFSFGIERSPEQLALNDKDHRKWTNPLEMTLPRAPSMSIQCLYGVGKETERSCTLSPPASLPPRSSHVFHQISISREA